MLLLASSGCFTKTAELAREWGPGPVRANQESPVLASGAAQGPDTVELPILINPPGLSHIGPCTVRAAWLEPADRDTLSSLAEEGVTNFVGARVLYWVGAEPIVFQPAAMRAERPSLVPPTEGRPDYTVEPFSGSLLVELWVLPDDAVQTDGCPVGAPATEPTTPPNRYLVDFGQVDRIGGGLTGGGVYLIGVVAVTALVALAFGG